MCGGGRATRRRCWCCADGDSQTAGASWLWLGWRTRCRPCGCTQVRRLASAFPSPVPSQVVPASMTQIYQMILLAFQYDMALILHFRRQLGLRCTPSVSRLHHYIQRLLCDVIAVNILRLYN
ncbi:hypothetical protein EJB05_47182, partial [Eragrostis curvula]